MVADIDAARRKVRAKVLAVARREGVAEGALLPFLDQLDAASLPASRFNGRSGALTIINNAEMRLRNWMVSGRIKDHRAKDGHFEINSDMRRRFAIFLAESISRLPK